MLAINGRGRERGYPVCQDGSVATLQQHAQLSPPFQLLEYQMCCGLVEGG